MNKQRLEAERLIYQVFDALDPDGENTDFYKEEFASMSDTQFLKFISNDFPFVYQTKAFKEPVMEQIDAAAKILNVPIVESVYAPHNYRNLDGKPIKTAECLVVYLPLKRMKQLLTKKNGMSINIKTRDMRSGLLTGVDKNGKESDKEFECLTIAGLDNTMKEFSRSRADSMGDKSAMLNTINVLGQVSLTDLPDELTDSLSKNLLSTYFIGAQLLTNLIVDPNTYFLPKTLKDKQNKIERK